MTSRSNSSHVLGATILGGIAGATIALLFAPRSGQETRDIIRQGAKNVKGEAKAKVDQAKSRLKDGVDNARDLTKRVSEAARDHSRQVKSELKNAKQKTTTKGRGSVLSAWEEEV